MNKTDQNTRRARFGLLPRIVVAIVLGVLTGLLKFTPVEGGWTPVARLFITFNGLFSQFLGFVIPVLILALVTPAIAELGRGAGKWLGITAGLAYLSTVIAGSLAVVVALLLFPRILSAGSVASLDNPEESFLKPYFVVEMPPPFAIMTALLLSFCLGVGLTLIRGTTLQHAFVDLRDIIVRIIESVIIPLLPIFIFGMFMNLTMNGQISVVIGTFAKVIVVVFALTLVWLLIQFSVAGAVSGKNPLTMLRAMMPAYFTALGTSSSAATIPVTLKSAKSIGVPSNVASFTVPLCATIHLAGSTLKIVSFAIAITVITGMEVSVPQLIQFVFMLGITMVAAPGVPGGAIVAASGILASILGFDEQAVGLMIAMYIAVDSFGTATNVTGDGALSAMIAKWSDGKLDGTRNISGEVLSDEALDRGYPADDPRDVSDERARDITS